MRFSEPTQTERLRGECFAKIEREKRENDYPEFYADVYGFEPKTSNNNNIVYEPNMDEYPAKGRV